MQTIGFGDLRGWPTLEEIMPKLARSRWAECASGPEAGSGILKRPRRYCPAPLHRQALLERGTYTITQRWEQKHAGPPPNTILIHADRHLHTRRTNVQAHSSTSGKLAKPKLAACISFCKIPNSLQKTVYASIHSQSQETN